MVDVPVAIIGAGPVGTAMALLLARAGVGSVILERRTERSDHPRAHYVNTRTMELFWQWGVHDEVVRGAFPPEFMPNRMMEMIGAPSREQRAAISPALVTSVAQDLVEQALQRKLDEYGGHEIRWGAEFESLADQGERVAITYRDPEGRRREISARWCVAADGAASPVRTQLGIPMIGDPMLDRIINIYFYGSIRRPGDAQSLGMQSRDPQVPGAFISMDGAERYCFHYLLADHETAEDFDIDRCGALVRRAAGLAEDHPLDIRAVKPWTMTALVAERFQQGSVFLAGDAAHAFPPSGGFGMNSGIGDVHNLAWKLAAALKGQAGPELLASYQLERQPVAFLNTAQSFRNARTMNLRRVPKPFNVSEETLAEIEARATRTVRSTAAEQSDPEARQRLEMLEHGAALGQELGYAYAGSPVVVEDGEPRPDVTVSGYVPNAAPGARAPHAWLVGPRGRLSTLQLFDTEFVLICQDAEGPWARAAAALEGPAVQLVAVGPGQAWQAEALDIGELYGITRKGAVLVRPDGHVAFRSRAAQADAAAVLQRAMSTALGWAEARRAAA